MSSWDSNHKFFNEMVSLLHPIGHYSPWEISWAISFFYSYLQRKNIRSHSGPQGCGICFVLFVFCIFNFLCPVSIHSRLFPGWDSLPVVTMIDRKAQSLLFIMGDFPGKNTGVGCHFLLQVRAIIITIYCRISNICKSVLQ